MNRRVLKLIARGVGPAVASLFALSLLLPAPAAAQPFGAWFTLSGLPEHGYIRVPHSAALNPTNRLTVEAWVSVTDPNGPGSCSSIAGKNWKQAWWVGICGSSLRSYLKGSASPATSGVIPGGRWTHIAVVFTGSRRIHYINGEAVLNAPLSGPLTTSTDEMRIGSDTQWQFTPQGAIDEVRVWSVARTQAQIRQNINKALNGPQPGLVGVWHLDGNPNDASGAHRDGSVQGVGTGFLTFPVALSCLPTALISNVCLTERFIVSARYRNGTPGTEEFGATVRASSPNSAALELGTGDIWQLLASVVDACASASRFTVAFSTPSSSYVRMEVFDIRSGVNRVYFHWPGPPTAAIIDTTTFTACP